MSRLQRFVKFFTNEGHNIRNATRRQFLTTEGDPSLWIAVGLFGVTTASIFTRQDMIGDLMLYFSPFQTETKTNMWTQLKNVLYGVLYIKPPKKEIEDDE